MARRDNSNDTGHPHSPVYFAEVYQSKGFVGAGIRKSVNRWGIGLEGARDEGRSKEVDERGGAGFRIHN